MNFVVMTAVFEGEDENFERFYCDDKFYGFYKQM